MEQNASWELDRQVVLTHLDHLILALRPGSKFVSKNRLRKSTCCSEHSFLRCALALQKQLLLPSPSTPSSLAASILKNYGSMLNQLSAKEEVAVARNEADSLAPRHLCLLHPNLIPTLTEANIFDSFCSVCQSMETSVTVTVIALSSLAAMLELPCSFVTIKGLNLAMEAAMASCGEDMDLVSSDLLFTRAVQVFVACIRHPAAVHFSEVTYVRLVGRTLVLSLRQGTSSLLKRTLENAMNHMVTCLFTRVIALQSDDDSRPSLSTSRELNTRASVVGELLQIPEPAAQSLQYKSATPLLTDAPVISGVVMMRFISNLISGKITSLNAEGDAVLHDDAMVSKKPQHSGGGNVSRKSKAQITVADSDTAVQLEGLWLAQTALFIIRKGLGKLHTSPLLFALQNDLSRALLIAGVSTTHVVVLAFVLRTIHIVVECAAEHLVPQILTFLRVLHFAPLGALTEKLCYLNGTAGSSSPTPSSAFSQDALSNLRLADVLERREIILSSLAEFCRDSAFCSFCFYHYDISWRHAALLQQLCDVLVSEIPEGSLSLTPWLIDGNPCFSTGAGARNGNEADRSGGNTADRITKSQLATLEAAANMVSEIVSRVMHCRHSFPQAAEIAECRAMIKHQMEQKKLLLHFANLFKESPLKKGIPFLLAKAVRAPRGTVRHAIKKHGAWLVLAEPAGGREIGACLFHLSNLLDKRALGEYIGELGVEQAPKPVTTATPLGGSHACAVDAEKRSDCAEDDHFVGSVAFFAEQLKGFVEQFSFANKSLLTAIREMVYRLCLPGESQKIDRVMEAFAKHWFAQNLAADKSLNPFRSESGAFVLSFAIIMLNTDLHSGRLAQSMQRDDFKNMNHGINDGGNVPDEYLFAIYEDVKQHEVIMAETIDRGFANDVTWNLEMTDAGSDYADALPPLTVSQHDTIANQQPTAASSSHNATTLTALQLQEEVLTTLDSFVFKVIWRHCLMIFSATLVSAAARVMCLNPQRDTLSEAVEDASATLPLEMSALLSSIHGISMLARAATALEFHEVADQCVITLLARVAVDFSAPLNALDHINRSLPTLLLFREIFALLRPTAVSLRGSWPLVGNLLMNLYLLGILTVRTEISKGAGGPTEGGEGRESEVTPLGLLKKIVFRSPGLSLLTQQSPTVQPVPPEKGSGWFTGLWGGSNRNSSEEARRDLDPARKCLLRVWECVPDMRDVLQLIAELPASPRVEFLRSLTLSHIPSTSNLAIPSGLADSYRLHLITACIILGAPSPMQPEVLSLFLNHLKMTLTAQVSASTRCASCDLEAGRGFSLASHPAHPHGSPMLSPHLDAVRHSVSGVIGLLHILFLSPRRIADSSTILISILNIFIEVPQPLFGSHVLPLMLQLLTTWASVLAASPTDCQADPSLQGSCDSLFDLKSGATGIIVFVDQAISLLEGFVVDLAVLSGLGQVLLLVTTKCIYDIASETEALVKAALALGILCSKQPHRSSPTPAPTAFSSTRRGNGSPGQVAESSVPSVDSCEGAAVNIIDCCARNAIRASHSNHTHLASAASGRREGGEGSTLSAAKSMFTEEGGPWLKLWLLSLRGLCALVLCSAHSSRVCAAALHAVQRLLLGTEMGVLPTAVIQSIYDNVLFPLTERTFAPVLANKVSPLPSPCDFPEEQADLESGASGAGGDRKSFVMSFLSLLAPLPSPAAEKALTKKTGIENGDCSPTAVGGAVSAEIKSRVVMFLPKVILYYAATLEDSPEVLQDLWQRVLGTLYAVYTAYPPAEEGGAAEGFDATAQTGHAVVSRCFSDETTLMRETVEETVKNMIYVAAASRTDTSFSSTLLQAPYFWTSTRNLIRPFPFSGPLLEFMNFSQDSKNATD